MKNLFAAFIVLGWSLALRGQDLLPYREIPPYPDKFTAANVAARIIDGLGFRYYWATEGLRPEDLSYQPNKDGRTSLETIAHIYNLSKHIVNVTKKEPYVVNANSPTLSFAEMRLQTLTNLKTASDMLKKITDEEMKNLKIVFKGEKETWEFPFWNELNGPIADALWHCGQVVSFRRGSGNPFNDKANVFTGKLE